MYKIITRDNGTCSGAAGGAARTWYDGPGRGSVGQAVDRWTRPWFDGPGRGSAGQIVAAEAQRAGPGPEAGGEGTASSRRGARGTICSLQTIGLYICNGQNIIRYNFDKIQQETTIDVYQL